MPKQATLALAELESCVAEGRFAEAVALGRSLLSVQTSASVAARIKFLAGTAYLRLSHPEPAEPLLADARTYFEASKDGAMLAECLGSEAALANLLQRPDALLRAQTALAVCRSLQPVPRATEARLLGTLASAHGANHEWDKAITFYEAAINAAEPLLDLRRMALLYSDVSSAYLSEGRLSAARTYAMRSVALLETLGDRIALARSENNLGLVFIKLRDFVAARQHLARSLELCAEADLWAGRSHLLLSLCELSLEEGDIEEARSHAADALDLAQRLGEDGNVAAANMWLGQIAERTGETDATYRHFDLAIRGFEAIGSAELLVQCHALYADILERRGDLAGAYVQMKQAYLLEEGAGGNVFETVFAGGRQFFNRIMH